MSGSKPAPTGKKGGIPARGIIAIILGVLFIIFMFLNTESIAVNLFGLRFTLPLWLLLLATFILGVLTSGMVWGGVRKLSGRGKKDD